MSCLAALRARPSRFSPGLLRCAALVWLVGCSPSARQTPATVPAEEGPDQAESAASAIEQAEGIEADRPPITQPAAPPPSEELEVPNPPATPEPASKPAAAEAPRKDHAPKREAPALSALGDQAASGTLGVLGAGQGGQGYGAGHGMVAQGRRAKLAAAPYASRPQAQPFDTEGYAHKADNAFQTVTDSPLSTFSIDVDTASYSNVRRFLQGGSRPPIDAVRTEELINYFRYAYPTPRDGEPFAVYSEVAPAPWNPRHKLVHIGLRAKEIASADTPARNLVFLVDVSGSMQSQDKLPLLKQGLTMLARMLRPQDRIAIAVYAGASGLALPSTRGDQQARILDALQGLEAGGSTNGAAGIELAYQVAQEQFIRGGINRVILATDGDFNVGVTSDGELTRLIEQKRKSGVFLTVLGFGTGNLQDATMELLADKGNGNYAYIDSMNEAKKVLVREAGSTLMTVAKDVKLQVEWNPKHVASYRLIGYENRVLADRDFNDDKKDAGEIGAGHTVTALYEVELTAGASHGRSEVDPLKYQSDRGLTAAANSGELLTLKVRYKQPSAEQSVLRSFAVVDVGRTVDQTSADFRWAAAVAGFGMLLRSSEHRGDTSFELIDRLARSASGSSGNSERAEFLELMQRAARMGVGG